MFYELYIYCTVILLFIVYNVILTLKISSTGPYLLARSGVLKIIELALLTATCVYDEYCGAIVIA